MQCPVGKENGLLLTNHGPTQGSSKTTKIAEMDQEIRDKSTNITMKYSTTALFQQKINAF